MLVVVLDPFDLLLQGLDFLVLAVVEFLLLLLGLLFFELVMQCKRRSQRT